MSDDEKITVTHAEFHAFLREKQKRISDCPGCGDSWAEEGCLSDPDGVLFSLTVGQAKNHNRDGSFAWNQCEECGYTLQCSAVAVAKWKIAQSE